MAGLTRLARLVGASIIAWTSLTYPQQLPPQEINIPICHPDWHKSLRTLSIVKDLYAPVYNFCNHQNTHLQFHKSLHPWTCTSFVCNLAMACICVNSNHCVSPNDCVILSALPTPSPHTPGKDLHSCILSHLCIPWRFCIYIVTCIPVLYFSHIPIFRFCNHQTPNV